jgi:tellurite resistance protein TehA-like permease
MAQNHGSPSAVADAISTLAAILWLVLVVGYLGRIAHDPGYWAFTFSWGAVCGLAVRWIAIQHPDSERLWAWLLTAAITAFIVYMVATSLRALAVGELLRPRAAS